ncbi:MFS transporter [Micromonospora sp. B11E3]|uniref:MFS transporter n=1 Tax=Micromonospora sp. B11E3 TaxID=3153562 RepID=UPI00325C886B
MNRRAGRMVLLGVVALHLIADSALSPFYPQLFRELFGLTDLTATGTYVWACRAAAVIALPLWGLAARRWPAHRLVVVGLVAAAVLDLALAVTPTYAAFTAVSVALVAATMAMALAYPALVALGDGDDRLPQVRAFAVVTHAATVAATLVGAGIMAMPQPRVGLAAFAVLDVGLAYACHRVLGRRPATAAAPPAAEAPATLAASAVEASPTLVAASAVEASPTLVAASAVEAPPAAEAQSAAPALARRPARAAVVSAVALVAGIVFVVEIGRNVVRPFFTAYVEDAGAGPLLAAGLFLLPSVAALAVLPAAEAARRRLGRALLPAAFVLAAVGLLVQALTEHPALVAVGRLVFGAGLGLGQVALDLRIFAATGVRGPAFAAVETVSTVAMLASPIVATAAVAVALPGPLLTGAAVFLVLAVLVSLGRRRAAPRTEIVAMEENRVPEPV